MKKALIVIIILFSTIYSTNAQDYNTGIGLRGGWFNGITAKHFIAEQTAIEGTVALRWSGISITGLYEIQKPINITDGLSWFYGGGAHIGFWEGSHIKWEENRDSYTVIGIDGIIGIEYTFQEIPLNLGIDWKPAYNLIGHSSFWGDGGAISVRYVF
ncbi:MAG: hypothetical protein GX128_04285 [Bacteroidales bacterium]|jgi:hypothetical protein|nr:hypothetical protein [Bacteroidales bacterium]